MSLRFIVRLSLLSIASACADDDAARAPDASSAPSCVERGMQFADEVADALRDRRACSTADDCAVITPRVICNTKSMHQECPSAIAKQAQDDFTAKLGTIKSDVCSDSAPTCSSSGGCMSRSLQCVAGKCTLVE